MVITNFNQPFTYFRAFANFTVCVDYAVSIQSKSDAKSLFVIQGCDAQCVLDIQNKGDINTDFKLSIKYTEELWNPVSDDLLTNKEGFIKAAKCKDNSVLTSGLSMVEGANKDGNTYKVIEVNPQFYSSKTNERVFVKPLKFKEKHDKALLKQHLNDEVKMESTNVVECKHCNVTLRSEKELQQHTDKPDNIYLCSNCNTSFQTKCQLELHKSFCITCKHCKKHFSSTSEFEEHSLTKGFKIGGNEEKVDNANKLENSHNTNNQLDDFQAVVECVDVKIYDDFEDKFSNCVKGSILCSTKDCLNENQSESNKLLNDGKNTSMKNQSIMVIGEVNDCRVLYADVKDYKRNTFTCDLCSQEFNTKCLLEVHENLQHFQHKTCHYCKITYAEKDVKFHSKSDLLTCGICSAVYLTDCLLKLHSFYCYECVKCKKLFKNASSYKKHAVCIESNREQEIAVSTSETEAVDSDRKIRIYKTFDNRAKLKNNLVGKQLMCAECGKMFKLPNQLKVHLTTHDTTRAYQCESCGKSFKTKSAQIMHRKSHAGIKPFQCDICDKSFTTKSALKLHLQLHSSVKPFTCNVCGKRFHRKHHLSLHFQVHTGKPRVEDAAREFQCETCGKSFATKTILLVHVRTHTGEKPYVCAECGRRFSQKNGLDYHERVHSGDKPFKCRLCVKSFGLKWQLVEHERVHTGERPFKCEVCDLSFSVRSNFYRHTKLHNE